MRHWLINYISAFSLQFVRGISILAMEADFERQKFLATTSPLPNFFDICRRFHRDDVLAIKLRLAIWSAIVIMCLVVITVLAFWRLKLPQSILLILIVVLPAPYFLIRIAAWCLPRHSKSSRA